MGKRVERKKKSVTRAAAFLLAVILFSSRLLPIIPLLPWKAEAARQGDTMTAYGAGFHHYCIDGTGANRALIDGDEYTYILPSETLTREEMALVFWGMLTLQASFGNVPQVNAVVRNINEGAAAQGVPAISSLVTEADLKLLIHSSAVRERYAWLKAVLAQEETYLRLAGLLGGTGGSGGTGIPAALQGHTQTGNPGRAHPGAGSRAFWRIYSEFQSVRGGRGVYPQCSIEIFFYRSRGLVYHAAAVWLGLPENRFADPSYEHGKPAAAST